MAEAVSVEGLDRLFVNIEKCDKEIIKAAQKGLATAGMQIIADAQRNMRTAGYNGGTLNNTGELSNSGKTQVLKDGSVEAGFFSASGSRGYAAVVEYGSNKKWWSPIAPLKAWAHKKLGLSEQESLGAAYGIRYHIHGHGLKPHPFFTPAVNKNKQAISAAISEAVAEVTKKDIK